MSNGPLIIYNTPQDKLLNPPHRKTITYATGLFAPRYKQWMELTHHPKLALILERYRELGYLRGPVVDIGCGTGVNSVTITEAYFKQVVDAIRIGNGGILQLPHILIALDFSNAMLKQARIEIEKSLERHVRLCQSIPGEVFHIDKSSRMTSRLCLIDQEDRHHEAIRIRFAHKNARALLSVKDGTLVSTAIISYVMHWLRGISEKQAVAETLANTLFVGALNELRKCAEEVLRRFEGQEGRPMIPLEKSFAGKIVAILDSMRMGDVRTEEKELVLRAISELEIRRRVSSIEEYPLVVRRDLSDDPQVQRLATWIERAVTVMPLQEIYRVYENAGFAQIHGTKQRIAIDEYHDMHGVMFELDIERKMNEPEMCSVYRQILDKLGK